MTLIKVRAKMFVLLDFGICAIIEGRQTRGEQSLKYNEFGLLVRIFTSINMNFSSHQNQI